MSKKYISYIFVAVVLVFSLFVNTACSSVKNTAKKETTENSRRKRFAYYSQLLEGVKNKNSGQFEAALESYIRAMRMAPEEAVSYYEIATILALMEDYQTALEYADKACKMSKDNYYYQLLKANLYQSSGMINKAAEQYNQLIRIKPEFLENYYQQASLFLVNDDYKKALKSFDKAEKFFGVNEFVNIEKFRIATEVGKTKLAYKEINKLIKAFPNDSRFPTLLAELYIEEKKYKEAESIFKKIEQMEINHGIVFLSLAEYYRIQNNIDKTFKYLNHAFESEEVNLDSKVEILYNFIGFSGNEQVDNHIYTLLETMVRTHPLEPKAHVIYSDYLVRDSKWKKAQEQLNLAVKSEKSLYPLWEQTLYVDAQLDDWESMYNHSTEAIQYFPLQVMLYMYNTVSASSLQKFEEVIASAKTGLKYSVGNKELQSDFYIYMAEAYHKIENYKESDEAFEEVLKREPENYYVLNNYAYYLALRNENIDRALQMAEQLVKIKPGQANYLDTYAWVLFRHQNFKEAKKVIEKAIEFDKGNNPTLLEHYGDILFFNDDIENAVKNWQKAIDADSKSETIQEKIKRRKYIEEI
ncbi:MAG: tetratricopeptide repeat protein [Bacteroidales bacterium]|nr:tetratricopeptide repeat protein [Bacteroidales bacterium]